MYIPRNTHTHLSQWSVQTFPAPPGEQAALLTPRVGPSGTPGPAACWMSYMMTTLGNPSFRLTEEQTIKHFCVKSRLSSKRFAELTGSVFGSACYLQSSDFKSAVFCYERRPGNSHCDAVHETFNNLQRSSQRIQQLIHCLKRGYRQKI